MNQAEALLTAGEARRVQILEDTVRRLQRDIRRLQTDAVTGVPVREVFERRLAGQNPGLGKRASDRFGILMIDIDHFKQFNDDHGHLEGDIVLRQVAQTIKEHLRPEDFLARYGGEEFVVIVPRVNRGLIARLAGRVRMGVHLRSSVTISVGYSIRYSGDESERAVVERADAALYEAKDAGRNRVRGNII